MRWTAFTAVAFLAALGLPASAADDTTSLSAWLDSWSLEPEFRPVLQSEAGGSGDGYFVTPIRGRMHLRPIEEPRDTFYDLFRVGVDSGLLYPLGAQSAGYDPGWWARIYGQASADLGSPLFRTSLEFGLAIGQSQSSRSDQLYRVTSNYTFLTIRGVADFMPTSTTDLVLFVGLGAGLEFARGHVIMATGRVEEESQTNFNPLVEAGAGLGFEISPGFILEGRITATHPLGSRNIAFFLQMEIGVQFLFI